jgi:hypothetical protein
MSISLRDHEVMPPVLALGFPLESKLMRPGHGVDTILGDTHLPECAGDGDAVLLFRGGRARTLAVIDQPAQLPGGPTATSIFAPFDSHLASVGTLVRDRGNERAEFAQSIEKCGSWSDHFHVGFVSVTSVALFIASGVILSKDFRPRPVTRTVARTSSHLSPILQT